MDEGAGNAYIGSYGWKTDLIALAYPIEAILIRQLLDLGPSFASTAELLVASTRLPTHTVHAGLARLIAANGVIKLVPPPEYADQTFVVYWLQKMHTFSYLSNKHSWVKAWFKASTLNVNLKISKRRAAIGLRTMLLKSASTKRKYVDSSVLHIAFPGPYIFHIKI